MNELLLTELLVGQRVPLYQNNATFKITVDTLVKMLPLWIDGIAAHAEEVDEQQRAAIEHLMNQAPQPMRIPGDVGRLAEAIYYEKDRVLPWDRASDSSRGKCFEEAMRRLGDKVVEL